MSYAARGGESFKDAISRGGRSSSVIALAIFLVSTMAVSSIIMLSHRQQHCECSTRSEGDASLTPVDPNKILPACKDGTSPGRWVDYWTWQSNTCAYRDFTKDDLHVCMANKWVHFVGDSTTQMLANKFAKSAKIYLHPCTNATNCLGYWKSTSHFLSISYRCKLSRQALPLPHKNSESDLGNTFFQSLTEEGVPAPHAIVISIGVHEVMSWSGRPGFDPPTMDALTRDLDELIALLRSTVPRSTRLIWWKAHFLYPGMVKGSEYYWRRKVYDEFLDYTYEKLGKEGFELMDLYQTTAGRPELPDNTGAHYFDPALTTHFRILANTLCNGGKRD